MTQSTINIISNEVAQSKPYLDGQFDVNNARASQLDSQRVAREALQTLVFPGSKDEPWRKTNISKLPLAALSLAGETKIELSHAPEGVFFLPIAEAMEQLPELLNEKLNKLVKPDQDKFSALCRGLCPEWLCALCSRQQNRRRNPRSHIVRGSGRRYSEQSGAGRGWRKRLRDTASQLP